MSRDPVSFVDDELKPSIHRVFKAFTTLVARESVPTEAKKAFDSAGCCSLGAEAITGTPLAASPSRMVRSVLSSLQALIYQNRKGGAFSPCFTISSRKGSKRKLD